MKTNKTIIHFTVDGIAGRYLVAEDLVRWDTISCSYSSASKAIRSAIRLNAIGPKYEVVLTTHDGMVLRLSVNDRSSWSKKVAQAHARDMRCAGLKDRYAKVEVVEL